MSALMDEVTCPKCGVVAANATFLAAHDCIDVLRYSVSEAEAECERLRTALHESEESERLALRNSESARAALAAAREDTVRLDWLADEPIFDGLGKLDIHDVACDIAGGAEVSPDKMRECYRKAIRVLIDAARHAGEGT